MLWTKQEQNGGIGFGVSFGTFKAVLLILILMLCSSAVLAQTDDAVKEELEEMGEEGLLMFFNPGDILVTSSARRPQSLSRATSAMYVITKEDIRQAGVTTMSDLLRLVPGMEVLQTNGYDSAVSARGFAKQSSQRLQTLLDGMPLYQPFRGGVDFNFHPLFLANIERIEVIRGSGGVIWGVNSMNGVINIITKKAADTQGGLGYGGFGNRATQEGFMRYGGSNAKMDWRGTVGASHNNGMGTNRGNDLFDYLQAFQSSGRADIRLADDTTLSFSGGHKNSTHGQVKANGTKKDRWTRSLQYMNLIWNKQLDEDESVQWRWSQNFYDQIKTANEQKTRENMLEFQHNFIYNDVHNIVWGADYTRDISHTRNFTGNLVSPDSFYNDQTSAYIQDEITLRDDLWLTLGYRGHYNEISHFDWAGSVALVHEVRPKHFLRAAVSRSFRRPILWEEHSSGAGNDSLSNEKLLAYELGYRGQLRDNLELNVEGFINKHEDLIGKVGTPYRNCLDMTTYGIETAIDWKPKDWWLVRAFHVYEHQTKRDEINSSTSDLKVAYAPNNKIGLTNRFYIDDTTTLNTQFFWNESCANKSGTKIPSYTRFDIRLAKRIWDDTAEIAFGATNLTDPMHYEGGTSSLSEVPRIVYMQFFYKF